MLRAAQTGTIKAIRPGRNWLVYASDIDRWKHDSYQPNMALRYPAADDDSDDAPSGDDTPDTSR